VLSAQWKPTRAIGKQAKKIGVIRVKILRMKNTTQTTAIHYTLHLLFGGA